MSVYHLPEVVTLTMETAGFCEKSGNSYRLTQRRSQKTWICMNTTVTPQSVCDLGDSLDVPGWMCDLHHSGCTR